MLETSARRALYRLGYKMIRSHEGSGFQVSTGESTWSFNDLAEVEAFILERRKLQVNAAILDGRQAQEVEVESRGFVKVVTAKPVRFQCAGCGQWFEQERFPSRRAAQGLLYHSEECRKEAERKKTRERVARYRAGKKTV